MGGTAKTMMETAMQIDDAKAQRFQDLALALKDQLQSLDFIDPERLEVIQRTIQNDGFFPNLKSLGTGGLLAYSGKSAIEGLSLFGTEAISAGEVVVRSGASQYVAPAISAVRGPGTGTAFPTTRVASGTATTLGAALSVGVAVYSVYSAYSTWNTQSDVHRLLLETIRYYENALEVLMVANVCACPAFLTE